MLLARAIETSDTQGKLLGAPEREEIDRLALAFAGKGSPPSGAAAEAFLGERARQILRIVENREPALASRQALRPTTRRLALAAFVTTVILGAATDRIANPHRVDLLSLPLLAIVAWNVLIYCAIIASFARAMAPRRRSRLSAVQGSQEPDIQPAAPSFFVRWTEGWLAWRRRSGRLRGNATVIFLRSWYAATAALQAQRLRKILHLAAAGWALGLVVSLFSRGLVVEYRIGWESTFLGAAEVHALLRVLLLPAMAFFQFQPFTLQDIENLRFGHGNGALAGARWVYIYAALLAVVVIAPRLALALYARWREAMLSRRIAVGLSDPYYQRLLAMLDPKRVQLGLLAFRSEDRPALLRILRPPWRTPEADLAADEASRTLIHGKHGEVLCLVELPNIPDIHSASDFQPPSAAVAAPEGGWTARLLGRRWAARRAAPASAATSNPRRSATEGSDVLLLLVRSAEDVESARPFLHEAGLPALLLVNSPAAGAVERCRSQAQASGVRAEALSFDSVAECWVQDPVLFDALARCVPAPKKQAFAGLADAWVRGNEARLAESMQVIATRLIDAARELEEAPGALAYLKRLTSLADRQAEVAARQAAIDAVVERLRQAARRMDAALLRLHGIDDAAEMPPELPWEAKFDVHASINAKEAGLAGAATGAASGASIDLVTGGLTLGMATALGALIGGGAAFAGAAWKNRTTPAGATQVQLGGDMLLAMAAAALLRYLAICAMERAAGAFLPSGASASWQARTLAAVEARKDGYTRCWAEARMRPSQPQASASLAGELQTTIRAVMDELYPGTGR